MRLVNRPPACKADKVKKAIVFMLSRMIPKTRMPSRSFREYLPAPRRATFICPKSLKDFGTESLPGSNPTATSQPERGGAGARRKPILLLRLSELLLFRFAELQLAASLFHDPPRFTRLTPWTVPTSEIAKNFLPSQMLRWTGHAPAKPTQALRLRSTTDPVLQDAYATVFWNAC